VAIVRRLDIDADQKITFEEWIDSVRPVVVPGGDEGLSSSSLGRSSPSRFNQEEEKQRSPLRNSQLGDSRGFGASTGFDPSASRLSVPGGNSSSYKPLASPSRLEVTRSLL
jgi:hypothetical protein